MQRTVRGTSARAGRSLAQRLLILVAVLALPVVAFSAAALWMLSSDKRNLLEQSMLESVRAIGGATDGELRRSLAVLQALAASDVLERGDLRAFYAAAKRVVATQRHWVTIALADRSGKYLFNTRLPYGSALPAWLGGRRAVERALDSEAPVVSDLFHGQVSGEALVFVALPVVIEGQARYLLAAGLRPGALIELIERQRVPDEGIVAISDGAGRIVARSRRHAEYLGTPVTPDLREAVSRHSEGVATLRTLDGQHTYAAFSRSPWSGWTVAIGVPSKAIDGPVQRSYLLLGIGIALSAALGTAVVLMASRRLSARVRELAEAAQAIGRGEQPKVPRTNVPEIDLMGSALRDASAARHAAEGERERLFESERQARAAAEQANRAKDEFLATLGHELRNPLAAIQNGVQLLLRRPATDELTRGTHALLARQVSHLGRLLDDLLQVSRVMFGKVALQREVLELGEHARNVVAALRGAGRLGEHALRLEAEPGVWIDGDPHRLEQILTNLLVNAEKYTPPGNAIDVRVAREGPRGLVEVRDSGVGMEAGLLSRVFEPFVQGERTLERSQGGLGIGLTLVRRLVELHGGTVEAHSPGTGQGSRFTVRLPLVPAPVRHAPAVPADRSAPGLRVLVVEDNDDARLSLQRLLEDTGHQVVTAEDGLRGVQAALDHSPHAALIDLGLPGLDGFECARRIRQAKGDAMLLVALTGYGLESDRERALDAGFDVHLTKPVSIERLSAALVASKR